MDRREEMVVTTSVEASLDGTEEMIVTTFVQDKVDETDAMMVTISVQDKVYGREDDGNNLRTKQERR